MKHLMSIFAVLTMCTGSALAASPDYEACARQEQTLKTRKHDDCSGLSYLFNPSACYAAQKALKTFESGPCRQLTPPGAAMPHQASAAPQVLAPVVPPNRPLPPPQPAATTAADTETLQAENIRLKAENAKLREEIQLIKSRSTPDPVR